MRKIFFFTAALFLAYPLSADSSKNGYFVLAENKSNGIQIIDAWARCSKTRNGSIYMKIKSPQHDRLVKAEARDTANRVEIHTHVVDSNGVAQMRPVPYLKCNANQETILKPMGDHIMLLGLKRKLNVGQQVNLILHFEKAGIMHVTVPVKQRQSSCCSCKA